MANNGVLCVEYSCFCGLCGVKARMLEYRSDADLTNKTGARRLMNAYGWRQRKAFGWICPDCVAKGAKK